MIVTERNTGEEKILIRGADTDRFNDASIPFFFSICQDAGGFHAGLFGFSAEELMGKHNWTWMILRSRIRFHKIPHLGDTIKVETWAQPSFHLFFPRVINGYTDKTFRDWDVWIATYAPNVIVVPKNSPYNTIQDLIEAMRANPGQITAGTAGIGSGGHFGAEIIKQVAGVDYKHITYAGGGPAFTATLSGEVDFCPQLLAEYKDAIISGDVKALCTLSDKPITIAEGITIPSIAEFYPEVAPLLPMGEVTGILLPKGLDEASLQKLDHAFEVAIQDPAFLEFCESRSFEVTPVGRADSQAYLEEFASKVCYILYDAGAAPIDPAQFGIERL